MNLDDLFNQQNEDQRESGHAEIAKQLHGYYRAMIDIGFSLSDAMELTKSYQSAMITMSLMLKSRDSQ